MKNTLSRVCIVCLAMMLSVMVLGAEASAQASAQTGHTVYLLRHFEKQVASVQSGKDVSLTKNGEAAALALAEFLQGKAIAHIFSTQYKRTQESLIPSAKRLALDIQSYDPNNLAAMATLLKSLNANAVVVGHSNTTPALFALLGCYSVSLSESDYNQVYKLVFGANEPTCSDFKLSLKAN